MYLILVYLMMWLHIEHHRRYHRHCLLPRHAAGRRLRYEEVVKPVQSLVTSDVCAGQAELPCETAGVPEKIGFVEKYQIFYIPHKCILSACYAWKNSNQDGLSNQL